MAGIQISSESNNQCLFRNQLINNQENSYDSMNENNVTMTQDFFPPQPQINRFSDRIHSMWGMIALVDW